jgi:hypothetical protein
MRRFAAKGVVFAVSLASILLGSEILVTSMTSWRRYEDPRARILWEGAFDGTRLVLLGGSEFASLYVDSASERLCVRLEAYSGKAVFPGALNGARLPDVLAAAMQVSREWPAGTTVLISLAPTRFVESRAEEPADGNFADVFFRRYGIDTANDGSLHRLRGQIQRWALRPFFADRTRSALANLVNRPSPPAWMRRRSWLEERAGVPKERFEFFERNLVMGGPPRSFESLGRIQHQLETAGMRSVFVLTPLNEPLVRSFASVHAADAILRRIRGTVAAVKTHLEARHAHVIDLTDGFSAECFFDLVHLNTCGDDLMAERLAEWLQQHPEDSRRLQTHDIR